MELAVAGIVFLAAAIHPLRDLLIKDNPNAASGYFSIVLIWLVIAAVQVAVTKSNLFSATSIWHLIMISSAGLLAYYLGILAAMHKGEFSVYYPIIRSAPVFMVVAGWLVLGESYAPPIIVGVVLVTLAVWLLQYRPGTDLLHDPGTLGAALLAMAGMGTQSLSDAEAMQHIEAPVLLFWEYVLVVIGTVIFLAVRKPKNRSMTSFLLGGWQDTPVRYLFAGCVSYTSYYLILVAYGLGGDAVAVNCLRQISIPLSVLLGGLFLGELNISSRFGWSLLLVAGIIIIIIWK